MAAGVPSRTLLTCTGRTALGKREPFLYCEGRANPCAIDSRADMRDVLLVVDVLNDFAHEDGPALLVSFRERHAALVNLLERARAAEIPIVFANDNRGVWDGDAGGLVRTALDGPAGDLVREIAPRPDDRFVIKPKYSAFDHTPLELILESLGCERIFLAGMSTEGCVTQSAIAARERGFKVTVVSRACATVDQTLEETALRYLVDVGGVQLASDDEIAR
jgi:nicotinamidase-related amidase